MPDFVKADVADDIFQQVERMPLDPPGSLDKMEVTRLGPLQCQIKGWPTEGGPPRYFLLQFKEQH